MTKTMFSKLRKMNRTLNATIEQLINSISTGALPNNEALVVYYNSKRGEITTTKHRRGYWRAITLNTPDGYSDILSDSTDEQWAKIMETYPSCLHDLIAKDIMRQIVEA